MSRKNRNKNNLPVLPNNQVQQHTKLIATKFSAGPIPPPEILEKYEAILPGLADRIMKQAENQTAHRIDLEKRVIKSDTRNSLLGIIFAFIIGAGGVAGGLYLTSLGMAASGLTVSGISLVSLVSAFIYGTNSRRKERQKKIASQ